MPDRVNRNQRIPVDGGLPAAGRWQGSRPFGGLFRLPWQAHCLACGEASPILQDLCGACHAVLPRIERACPRCALPLASTADCCAACLRSPPPLCRVVAAFAYADPLDRWLPRFKFHGDLAAGRLLSQLMWEACSRAPRPDALVPVPLHRTRLRSRGYDQALELARPLARTLALPLRTDLLRRRRNTTAQSSLQAADRLSNLAGAFAATGAGATPLHVALVDDVMTTGATLHAAAGALRRAGAARVDAWICARAT